ncbi:MAG: metallophosphoesterase [Pseudolabrys sp.]|nr:metallophosphoesterase [Pseudolabrys sp.]
MFTLAHLSDPHLAPLPQPHWRDLLGKRVTGYINWQRNRRFIHDPAVLAKIVADMKSQAPGHIAVTGDIANIALPAEFVRGREWLESLGTPRDVTFVPGNHDIYVPEAAGYAVRQWGAQMSDDDGIAGFPFLRRRGPLALIGVTSGVPTAPLLATGWLGTAQLAGLAETLNQLKGENLFRVLLIHHPPVSKAGRTKALLDAPVLLRIIAAHGADLVIHGHDHVHMLNWLQGPNGTRVPAVGVPSASAAIGKANDAAAYHLYRIAGAPGAWSCELISRGMTPEGGIAEQKRFVLSVPSP